MFLNLVAEANVPQDPGSRDPFCQVCVLACALNLREYAGDMPNLNNLFTISYVKQCNQFDEIRSFLVLAVQCFPSTV